MQGEFQDVGLQMKGGLNDDHSSRMRGSSVKTMNVCEFAVVKLLCSKFGGAFLI